MIGSRIVTFVLQAQQQAGKAGITDEDRMLPTLPSTWLCFCCVVLLLCHKQHELAMTGLQENIFNSNIWWCLCQRSKKRFYSGS